MVVGPAVVARTFASRAAPDFLTSFARTPMRVLQTDSTIYCFLGFAQPRSSGTWGSDFFQASSSWTSCKVADAGILYLIGLSSFWGPLHTTGAVLPEDRMASAAFTASGSDP